MDLLFIPVGGGPMKNIPVLCGGVFFFFFFFLGGGGGGGGGGGESEWSLEEIE